MGGNPQLSPQESNDASTTALPNNEEALFTERALLQCMELNPQTANLMANSCNGIFENGKNDSYNQVLPQVDYTEESSALDLSVSKKIGQPTSSTPSSTDTSPLPDSPPKPANVSLNEPAASVNEPLLSTLIQKKIEPTTSVDRSLPASTIPVQPDLGPAQTANGAGRTLATADVNSALDLSLSQKIGQPASSDSALGSPSNSNYAVNPTKSTEVALTPSQPAPLSPSIGNKLEPNPTDTVVQSSIVSRTPLIAEAGKPSSLDSAISNKLEERISSNPASSDHPAYAYTSPKTADVSTNSALSSALEKKIESTTPPNTSNPNAILRAQTDINPTQTAIAPRQSLIADASTSSALDSTLSKKLGQQALPISDSPDNPTYAYNSSSTNKSQPVIVEQSTIEKAGSITQGSQTTIAQNQTENTSSRVTTAITNSTNIIDSATTSSKPSQIATTDVLAANSPSTKPVPVGSPSIDATSPTSKMQLADAANPTGLANNPSTVAQLLDTMQKNIGLSRESNSALLAGSPATQGVAGISPFHMLDAAGKPIATDGAPLTIKEYGAQYTASTANAGTGGQNIKDAQVMKEGQLAANTSTSQNAAQALQGLLQQGQAATGKLDETGKAAVKGGGASTLTDASTTTQSGKTGATSSIEGAGNGAMILPGMIITKGGKAIDGMDETKLPIAQTGNATTTGIIITPTAGAIIANQTAIAGQAGTNVAGTTGTNTTGTNTTSTNVTGSVTSNTAGTNVTGTNTTGTNTTATTNTTKTPGTQDPNATDIKSLVGALPTVEITGAKKGIDSEDQGAHRPEIDYDSVDDNDFDDDNDDFVDTPVVDGKRTNSPLAGNVQNKSAKLGLSIIENIMVLINDLKNQKVDDQTAKRMWADLFIDIFGKQKRQPYAVKTEDTLENIARYMLKDTRLAPLLYTINVHAKIIKPLKNVSVETISAIKPETQKILLPHRSEILRYKIHVLKEKQALVIYARSGKNADAGFTTYRCREGDTLKSIAISHIDTLDENMWTEIALLNGLSVRTGKNGEPIAKLKEAQVLKIPKRVVQDEFEDDELDELLETPVKNVDLGGPIMDLDINIADQETLTKALAKMEKRIISQSDLGAGKDSMLIKLELKEGNNTIRVAEWDVNSTSSSLKLYDKFGNCKIITVALPTRAARELAENDLKANAERYCKMFLTGELAA